MTLEQFEAAQLLIKQLAALQNESEWLNGEKGELDLYQKGRYRFIPIAIQDTLIQVFKDYYKESINELEQKLRDI